MFSFGVCGLLLALLLFLGPLVLGEASCRVMRRGLQMRDEASCQQPCVGATLEKDPGPSRASDDCSPSCHLDCNLIRNPEPRMSTQLSCPDFLTCRNCL